MRTYSELGLDRAQWEDALRSREQQLGYTQGYKLLFCPWATLKRARVAFISLNPGRPPDGADLRVVSDERGNSYEVERSYTASPITEQFLQFCDFLDVAPSEVLTGVAAPFRSCGWGQLSSVQKNEALAMGTAFWSQALNQEIKMVVAVSKEAARVAQDALGARFETAIPSGWGEVQIQIFQGAHGRRLVQLPHLSRFKLFGRPGSEPYLRKALL